MSLDHSNLDKSPSTRVLFQTCTLLKVKIFIMGGQAADFSLAIQQLVFRITYSFPTTFAQHMVGASGSLSTDTDGEYAPALLPAAESPASVKLPQLLPWAKMTSCSLLSILRVGVVYHLGVGEVIARAALGCLVAPWNLNGLLTVPYKITYYIECRNRSFTVC